MAPAKAQTKRSTPRKSSARPSNSRGAKSRGSSANSRGSRSNSGSGARSRASSAKRPSARRTRSASSRPSTRSSNGGSATESIKDTVASQAGAVAEAAQKAKAPLIAGGATIAGVAGAVALASRSSGGPKVLGIRVGRRNGFRLPGRSGGLKRDARKVASAITEAAARADRFGQRVSKLASTIRQVSETADDAAKKA
jgi:hypothetical protein